MDERIRRIFGVFEMKKTESGKGQVFLKLNGGLGNQMFQWALARMIQVMTDMDVYLDMSYFNKSYARPYQLDIFNFQPQILTDPWMKLKLAFIWKFRAFFRRGKIFGITLFSERHFQFDPNIQKIKNNTYIEGFFQSEKYFKDVEEYIKSDFKFSGYPVNENKETMNKIYEPGTSISLHIRRGDYVDKKRYQDLYAKCSIDYYKRAVEYIAQKYPNPKLFVFSDDIKWVQRRLNLPYETIFVANNTGEKDYEDMRLMSMCAHNIISNSTFSWWAAWLNPNPNKIVIAPKKWFNDDSIVQTDIIPKEWVQLDN